MSAAVMERATARANTNAATERATVKANMNAVTERVTAKDEKTITFDANHEMAGKELNFRIELVEVEAE